MCPGTIIRSFDVEVKVGFVIVEAKAEQMGGVGTMYDRIG